MYLNEAEKLYKKAKECGDKVILAKFKAMGKDEYQQIENFSHYDQWLSCGFKGEPVYDEWGWVKNKIPEKDIDRIYLWDRAYIDYACLPNGLWASGVTFDLSETGYYCSCDIFSDTFPTKNKAIEKGLKQVEEAIRHSHIVADRQYQKYIDKARLALMQPTLF